MTGSARTTLPGPGRGERTLRRADLAVRWVYPALDGMVMRLPPGRFTIGRDEGCACTLPGMQVSRRHAEITHEGALRMIVDLDSRNGLFVDGTKVKQSPLRLGSVVRIGEWVGVLTMVDRDETNPVFHEILPGYVVGPALSPRISALRRAAASDLPIIVQGETGTGKEGAARAAHMYSGRNGPFLAINCAALPEHMAEGELFGYRKGAFTGADRANPGHLRAAQGGTLFLDEVADLSPALQAKLLRALEQREVVPLGESAPVPIDVRLVAAAQSPLSEMVEVGKFRGDLFARLDGFTLELPPLRERLEDIPFLFMRHVSRHCAGKAPEVDAALIERLCLYDWPFNLRELERTARQVAALHSHEPVLLVDHLPTRFRRPDPASAPNLGPITPNADAAEPELPVVLAALRTAQGNVKKAALSLGISRQRLYRMLESEQGIDLSEFRQN